MTAGVTVVEGSRYRPFRPARRPAGRPDRAPKYRVLVHRAFFDAYSQLVERVGRSAATQFWDHVSTTPGSIPGAARSSMLRGRRAEPIAPGFSRTYHWDLSGAGRADYQFNDYFRIGDGDPHRVVVIVSISYSSH